MSFHAKIIQPAVSETIEVDPVGICCRPLDSSRNRHCSYPLITSVPTLAGFQDVPFIIEVSIKSFHSAVAPANSPRSVPQPLPPIPSKFTPTAKPAPWWFQPTYTFTARLSANLLPAEALRNQLVAISDPDITNAFGMTKLLFDRGSYSPDIDIPSLPANIAHDVFIVHNNTEGPIGTLTASRGDVSPVNFSPLSQSAPPTPPLLPTVTLVFRPNPQAALTTVDLTSCADTTFTLENVPFIIGPTFPTTAPTTTPTTTPTP